MKQLYTPFLFIVSILLLSFNSNAQAPQSFSYQAVARDANGNILSNKTISLRFSIRDVTAAGTIVYQETQTAATNNLGLANVSIGQGTPATGTFPAINWAVGSKFLEVEIDPNGGSTYTSLGVAQMLSVPYALYAANGGGGGSGGDVTEVYGTGTLALSAANTTFQVIPGLTATINVPANSKIIVHTDGAVATTAGNAAGYAGATIAILMDNTYVGEGGYKNIYTLNNTGLGSMFTNYSITKTFDSSVIGAGNHTFTASAFYLDSSNGTVRVSSDNSSVLQGVLTVTIIKK